MNLSAYLILLIGFTMGDLVMPEDSLKISPLSTAYFTFDGDEMTLLLSKKSKGYMALGFGPGMIQSDMFIIHTQGEKISILNCKTVGHQPPRCELETNTWSLIDSVLNSNGSWIVKVKKNLKDTVNDIQIVKGTNQLIYSHSDNVSHLNDLRHTGINSYKRRLTLDITGQDKFAKTVFTSAVLMLILTLI